MSKNAIFGGLILIYGVLMLPRSFGAMKQSELRTESALAWSFVPIPAKAGRFGLEYYNESLGGKKLVYRKIFESEESRNSDLLKLILAKHQGLNTTGFVRLKKEQNGEPVLSPAVASFGKEGKNFLKIGIEPEKVSFKIEETSPRGFFRKKYYRLSALVDGVPVRFEEFESYQEAKKSLVVKDRGKNWAQMEGGTIFIIDSSVPCGGCKDGKGFEVIQGSPVNMNIALETEKAYAPQNDKTRFINEDDLKNDFRLGGSHSSGPPLADIPSNVEE